MNELFNQVLEQLRNTWRFRWYAMLVAWAICLVGWLIVYGMPNEYQVKARVRIDTTSVIQPLIKDLTVSPDAGMKVDLLIHTVLSKPNLTTIARDTGLDIRATTPAAQEQLMANLRHKIHIRSERSRINLYSIAYSGSDANTARNVVQSVINVMTGMALGNGVKESEQAIGFLSSKVDDYHGRLRATEKKLTKFKKAHPELVQGREGYLARLQTTSAVLQQMKLKLKTLLNKQQALQDKLKELGGESIAVPASQSPKLQALDKRIDKNQEQLTQLLTRYTPQHPDVVRHKNIIQQLQNKRSNLMAQLRAHPEHVPGTSSSEYRQAQQKLDELQIEIDTLRSSIDEKSLQTNILSANSGKATDAAAQLADLSRDYESTKAQYETLLGRLNKARMSRDVDSLGDPLDFKIIDPPELPDTPSGPPRLLFMLVVLLAGLGGGGAFAFFLAQIKPVFMTRNQLARVTDLPVLGAVSMAWNVRQRVQRRTNVVVFALAMGILLAGFAAAVVLMPIGIRVVPALIGGQWL